MNNIFLAGGFRIENPSRNTLSSTAYFAKPRYGISLPRYAKSRSLLTTVKYKIDNNSKTKNCTEKTHEYNNFDHNIVHLLRSTSLNLVFLTQKLLKVTVSQKRIIAHKKIIYAKNESQVNSNLPCKFGHF